MSRVRGRVAAIERRFGIASRKQPGARPAVGYLMVTRGGGLVEAGTGERLTPEDAGARFPIIYHMPDNGRDPELLP